MTAETQPGAPARGEGPLILHATAIAAMRGGRWRGVLVQGPSGAGKSDLAIRAIASGWRLVADDRTLLWVSGGRLFARAPATLAGLVEARHLGVLPMPALAQVELGLVVDAAPAGAELDRVPSPQTVQLLQASLPRVRLMLREPSAPAKLALALEAALALTGGRGSVSSGAAERDRTPREDV